jgi:glycerone phosphate O-acyltransferase
MVIKPTIYNTRGEYVQAAAQHLILTLYKNQLMHIFVRVAMVTLSINSCTEETLAMSK